MRVVLAALAMALSTPVLADGAPHFAGDLGLGVERTQACAPGARARVRALPYAYGDYGPLFVREDTFGVKLLPVGWGSLELVGRASTEGTDADGPGLAHRANPRPVGVGTFQETPWGGVFADAFVDTVSGGTLLEASYAAEVPVGPVTFYPQVGLVRRSARYDAHLDDVHAASTTPVLQLSAELPVGGKWVVLAHAQVEPIPHALRESERVDARERASVFVALAWRFK
jgi:outer membrane protein